MAGPTGRTVLVAGATSASGLAATRTLLSAGARVVATGRSPERLAPLQALGAQVQAVDLADERAVAGLARSARLDVATDPAEARVVIDGTDVTAAVREPRVSAAVSTVARNFAVREELVRRQREVVRAGGVVLEGRDTTTVVAPDAPVRILLTADEQARLARRAREVHGADDAAALAATRDQVLRRDADDSTVSSFFTAADGVLHLDSSGLDFAGTVEAVLAVVHAAVPRETVPVRS